MSASHSSPLDVSAVADSVKTPISAADTAMLQFYRDRASQLSCDIDIEGYSVSPMSITARSETTNTSTTHSPILSHHASVADDVQSINTPPTRLDLNSPLTNDSAIDAATPVLSNTAIAAVSIPYKTRVSNVQPSSLDGITCYCKLVCEDKQRPMLQCIVCSCWFHQACIETIQTWTCHSLLGDDYYQFTCKTCGKGKEVIKRLQLSWGDVVHIVLFNLTQTVTARLISNDGRKFYNWRLDICKFIDTNWDLFWLKPRPNTWKNSVASCLSTSARFVSGVKHFGSDQGFWALAESSFPSASELSRKSKICAYLVNPDGLLFEEEGGKKERKRKKVETNQMPATVIQETFPLQELQQLQSQPPVQKSSKPKTGTTPMVKTESNSNWESVADNVSIKKVKRQARPKKQIDADMQDEDIDPATAIMIYPDVDNPASDVVMSHQPTHTAPQIKFSDGGRQVTNEKGYRMAKASHGVWSGHWYFEIKKENAVGHCRVGWSQISGDLQAPCGYDQFSYSYRDNPGALFHQSCQAKDAPKAYAEGFGQGDVIGMSIYFPPEELADAGNTPDSIVSFVDQPLQDLQSLKKDKQSNENECSQGFQEKTVDLVLLQGQITDSQSKSQQQAHFQLEAEIPMQTDHSTPQSHTYTSSPTNTEELKTPPSQFPPIKHSKVHPVLLRRLWDAARMLHYMPFRSKPLEVIPGTEIQFFKNGVPLGVAFKNLYQGKYHPAVSLYGGALVRVNFGPNFAHPVPNGALPFFQVKGLLSWNKLRDANRRNQSKEHSGETMKKQASKLERKNQKQFKSQMLSANSSAYALNIQSNSIILPAVNDDVKPDEKDAVYTEPVLTDSLMDYSSVNRNAMDPFDLVDTLEYSAGKSTTDQHDHKLDSSLESLSSSDITMDHAEIVFTNNLDANHGANSTMAYFVTPTVDLVKPSVDVTIKQESIISDTEMADDLSEYNATNVDMQEFASETVDNVTNDC
ncbi:hypothetical protein BDV3_000273 [Batrachochytrium dendrobatidis]